MIFRARELEQELKLFCELELGKNKKTDVPGLNKTENKHEETVNKSKVLPEPQGPRGGADLRFLSPQPDTSLHCETTDTGLMCHAVCPFTPQLSLVLIAPTHGGMARMS